MKTALPSYKLIPSSQAIRLYLFALIAVFTLAGCGSQDETPPQTSTLSFKLSDTLLGSRLDQGTGALTIFVSVDGASPPQAMTISGDGLTASITLDNIATGSREFTIDIFYDDGSSGNLQVASGTKNAGIVEGSNTLNFVTLDFDTASFDADSDGLSNLVELDEFSTTSPISCVLGTSELGNCELGS